MLIAMAACTATDALMSMTLIFASTALQRTRGYLLSAVHLAIHVCSLAAELGIAAVTVALWVASNSIDGRPVTVSTYLFFAAGLASTLLCSAIALHAILQVARGNAVVHSLTLNDAPALAVAASLLKLASVNQRWPDTEPAGSGFGPSKIACNNVCASEQPAGDQRVS